MTRLFDTITAALAANPHGWTSVEKSPAQR
jgi:hypothetical protein